MSHNFQLIAKARKYYSSGDATIIVDELTDNLFTDGWRFVMYLNNSSIDYIEYIANKQEEDDKSNNDLVVDHEPIKIKHDPNHKDSIFLNCDGWRHNPIHIN